MSDVLELLARANPIPKAKQPEMEERASALADSWRLRTAAAKETAPRSPWRPATVAIGALSVLVVAVTALALRGHWLDFSKAEHASPRTVTPFSDLDRGVPPGTEPGVVAGEARRVLVATRTFWVAPTKRGGFCAILDIGRRCVRLGAMPWNFVWQVVPAARRSERRVTTQIYGVVDARWVDSVLIRFADGGTARPLVTWVSKPIDGGFFYYDVPPEHRVVSRRVTKLEALDADGNVVTESNGHFTNPPIPPADAIQAEKTAVVRAQTPDGEAILWRAPTRYRTTCAWVQLGGRAHMVGACVRSGPTFTFAQTRRSVVVAGRVDPRFDRVELEFADLSHVSAKLVHGFLLYSIPPEHLVAAKQLVAIRLVNKDGSAAFEDQLTLGLSGCHAPLPTTETCR